MNNGKSVAVLMSVYNPNLTYFEQQISSISNQDYATDLIKIFIRDDGSTLSNRNAIKQIVASNSLAIEVKFGQNVGPADSFRNLILQADIQKFDYIALADQDDIWESNKLTYAVQRMEQDDSTNPILFYSNASFIGENSQVIDGNLYAMYPTNTNIFDIMMNSDIYGMAIVFNNAMLEQLKIAYPEFVTAHDHWIAIVAFSVGKIIYTEELLVKYRQHGNNVVGAISKKTNYAKILIKHLSSLQSLCTTLFEDSKTRSIESNWLLDKYNHSIHKEVRDDLKILISSRDTIKSRIRLIRNTSYHGRNKLATCAIYFRTILGHV